jgi:DNA (cytosine-5)-methyltransferase 1
VGNREGMGLEPCGPKALRGPSGRPTVLDLFSGIGGFALAFEAAGFETVAFAEIEPYPCKVLAQHWPEVPNLGDVRAIDGDVYRGAIDVVCGGFPCQDISTAGKGAGIHGARSGLWFEMLRIIRGARPAFCLLENVPALRGLGADDVLEGLEEAGYTGRPFVVGAVHSGAPHRRQRAWIVAYADDERRPGQGTGALEQPRGAAPFSLRQALANTNNAGQSADWRQGQARDNLGRCGAPVDHPLRRRYSAPGEEVCPGRHSAFYAGWWSSEPALGRVAHGVPHRAHRIKALGNSIVPAVAYPFAQWIYGVLTAHSAPERSSAEGSNP